jgi:hypothetical protein
MTKSKSSVQISCPHCEKPIGIVIDVTVLKLHDCGWFGFVTEQQCKDCALSGSDRLIDCPEPVDDEQEEEKKNV